MSNDHELDREVSAALEDPGLAELVTRSALGEMSKDEEATPLVIIEEGGGLGGELFTAIRDRDEATLRAVLEEHSDTAFYVGDLPEADQQWSAPAFLESLE